MNKFASLLLVCLLFAFTTAATVRTTVSSGDWNNPIIWGGTVPLTNDDAVISTGHIVTINVNPNNITNVTINGTLQWDATGTARTWTVTGNFTINGTGSFICATPGTATTHTFNYNGASFTNNGTMNLVNGSNKCNMVVGSAVTQTIGGTNTLNLNKLTLNNTGGKFVIDYGAGAFTPSETAPTKLNVSVTTADTMVIKQGLLIGCATNNATISHSFAHFKMGSGTAKITSSVNVFTSIVTLTVNAAMILNDATNSNVTMTVNGTFTSPSMTQSNAATAFGVLGPNCFGGAGNATALNITGAWNMTDIFVFVGNTKVFGGTEPNNPTITASSNISWASSETHTIDLPFTSDDFYVKTCYFGLFDSQGAFPQVNLNGGSVGTPNTFSIAFDVFDAEVQSSSPLGSETIAQISESMSNWTVNGHWKILNGASLAVHSDNTLTVNGSLRVQSGGEVAGSETESEDIGYIPTNGPTISMGGSGVLYVENLSGLGKGLLTDAASNVAIKNRTADIDWNLNAISTSGTVDYAAAAAQPITDRTYNHLTTSSSGAKTLSNAI
ncbi:MAG TPA: G8 domain-containing protein, partial [Chitinophagales bacterium]|nr:G8 domain-containing protein [Chitinophagales bacterium]